MDQIGIGGLTKSIPVFSFNTIVDMDVSLIAYVYNNYYDTSVFNFDGFDSAKFLDLIGMIYLRKCKNPLKLFALPEVEDTFLDECYKEFIETKQQDILEYSVLTEIPKLISNFLSTSEIIPKVMYYNQNQLNVLNQIERLDRIEKIPYQKINNTHFTQLYLKDITECKNIECEEKTIYFASNWYTVNSLDKNELSDEEREIVSKIFLKKNNINVFDLYRMNLINPEGE